MSWLESPAECEARRRKRRWNYFASRSVDASRVCALRSQRELLHAPVQDLGDPELILRWARDLVYPPELLCLFPCFAEYT